MSTSNVELLFAYGSLKRGFANHEVLSGAPFVGEALTRAEYALLALGPYPALAGGGARAISGELYQVSPELLARLDAFEGEDYVRALVTLADGRQAQAYFITEVAREAARPLQTDVWNGYDVCT